MREIKFRGKNLYGVIVRQEDGDDFTEIKEGCMWLYGGYAEIDGKGYIFPEAKCHQAHGDYWTDDDAPDIPIVDKETVGEYTGLKDRNGREIYEGDIIKVGDEKQKIEVRFVRGVFAFLWNGNLDDEFPCNAPTHEWAEVMGNIYDNPNLIKKQ